MGEHGEISRILGKKFGNYITFASLNKEKESAHGQILFKTLNDIYNYKNNLCILLYLYFVHN